MNKNNDSLVSIIIPCYNHGKFLFETLNSVLNQTYRNWECIIINDGSTDNTESIANEFCKRNSNFKYFFQNNQGVSNARNNGIKKSTGNYILPLDGDDLIDPSYIQKAINRFTDFPNTTLVYCKADRFGEKKEYWDLPEYNYETEIWNNVIFCSAIFKREDFDKTNGYNPNMKEGLEDWDFLLSLLNDKSIVYCIPEVLFHYRAVKKSRNTEANKKVIQLNQQIVINHYDIYKEYLNNIINYKYESMLYQNLMKSFVIKLYVIQKKIIHKVKNKILYFAKFK